MRRFLGLSAALVATSALFGLSTGQALATHVGCGDVITQDTTLDSDLIDCPGDGIVLGADNITLDLNRHAIDGISTSFFHGARAVAGSGDYPSRLRGVTIENGSIQGFSIGVALSYVADVVIRRLAVSGTGIGLEVHGEGMRIARNSIRDSVTTGMDVLSSTGSVIKRNRLADNPRSGIEINGGGNELIERNSVSGSEVGIRLNEGPDNAVIENSVFANGVGIQAIYSAYRTRIERNFAYANAEDGIQVECCQSLVRRNVASRNGDDGIYVAYGGVDEFGPDVVSQNTANYNRDLGIELQGAGVVDGGGNRAHGNGNRAHGNGNPAQCLNVTCNARRNRGDGGRRNRPKR